MDTEQRLKALEDFRKLVEDHDHTGVDFKQVSASNVTGITLSVISVARFYKTTNQSITANNQTLQFNTESYNTGTDVTFIAASYKFTVNTAGKYRVTLATTVGDIEHGEWFGPGICVDGTPVATLNGHASGSVNLGVLVCDVLDLTAGQEITAKCVSTNPNVTLIEGSISTYMVVERIL